ncbi:UNVERIFIED_ORG: glutathione-regulated potassium-efflux system ancillary protein KefF [Rhizobium sp. SORGH_AS260]|uniref:NAD(P)H-dependent oxidoreductase n=1 Tax=Agrobacterium sp. SORGH_AS_0440 TaxID=3041757 RepID=UPI001152CF9E|nr:NAD(P)H-dependent oxidoreductase [Agrobacterium sp. SORGH_AS_0440]MDP9734767.1 glutathione-regulated potassium-efflux system ancillary protein KefF [Rhizobium sp. SORGH_AS_0285]MDP9756986.1 glutathione-regulated potassium-efflux system ancillary protein KefF [Rhizobium sp. SORGH_AS_0260]MDR6083765.1 glutathione-regulated potassium-efflux system ancillary protein KefF [Agrobacterium sp. SORGH_AS_0440]
MNRRDFLKAELELAASLGSGLLTASPAQAQTASKPHRTDIKTLLIASHPYPERSVMIKGLQHAAESIDGVTVRNLETIYGFDTRAIKDDEERELTRSHDRIVFLFPTHWFNITPMMRAYLNDVWGSVGPGLWQGKEMLVVTTAGGGASTYGSSGRIGIDLADVFWPMKASALHCGMTHLPPLAFQAVTPSELPQYQQQLIERLQS